MNKITYNSFNDKLFYEMTKSELEHCIDIIKSQINVNQPTVSDQEDWIAFQNANFNLNKFV